MAGDGDYPITHSTSSPTCVMRTIGNFVCCRARPGMDQLLQVMPGGQECGGHELLGVARPRHRDLHHLAHSPRVRVEHQDSIGQVDRLFEIVRDEDDGDVDLLPDLQEVALHLRARLRVERAERLVHQENARPVGERAGDGDALLHSTRKLMRVGVGEALEPDQVDPLARLALRRLTRARA